MYVMDVFVFVSWLLGFFRLGVVVVCRGIFCCCCVWCDEVGVVFL